jgi:hypothetical protein
MVPGQEIASAVEPGTLKRSAAGSTVWGITADIGGRATFPSSEYQAERHK